MTKRSKSPANKGTGSDVQRATLKRAQSAGKRQARAQAERTAGAANRSTGSRTVPVTAPAAHSATPAAGLRRQFVWLLILVVLVLIGAAASQNSGKWLAALRGRPALNDAATPTASNNSTANEPAALPTASAMANIGIISGHRGNDSGAICDDGLTEASINYDTATRVAGLLRAEGYEVTILDEFDPRLNGYKAAALLSIHSDSCKYINDQASGYKIARFLYSDIPQVEDQLVACVSARYKKATGLRFHANTVTHNMLEYHALRKIDPKTPGAIIELGFMNLDRSVLTRRKDDMARGIAGGLTCFLTAEKP